MTCRLIEAERGRHSLAMLCRALRVCRSGFHAWRGRPVSDHTASDVALAAQVAAIHHASDGSYGAPRVHAEVAARDPHQRQGVARLMAEQGLEGVSRRRRRLLDDRPPSSRPAAPDLVDRRFGAADGPSQMWLADPHLRVDLGGRLYVVLVVDAGSRRIVGWAMRESLEAALVVDALKMAATCRRPPPGRSTTLIAARSTARRSSAAPSAESGWWPRWVPAAAPRQRGV